jgi:hypothetical protein
MLFSSFLRKAETKPPRSQSRESFWRKFSHPFWKLGFIVKKKAVNTLQSFFG